MPLAAVLPLRSVELTSRRLSLPRILASVAFLGCLCLATWGGSSALLWGTRRCPEPAVGPDLPACRPIPEGAVLMENLRPLPHSVRSSHHFCGTAHRRRRLPLCIRCPVAPDRIEDRGAECGRKFFLTCPGERILYFLLYRIQFRNTEFTTSFRRVKPQPIV